MKKTSLEVMYEKLALLQKEFGMDEKQFTRMLKLVAAQQVAYGQTTKEEADEIVPMLQRMYRRA